MSKNGTASEKSRLICKAAELQLRFQRIDRLAKWHRGCIDLASEPFTLSGAQMVSCLKSASLNSVAAITLIFTLSAPALAVGQQQPSSASRELVASKAVLT